MTRLSTTEFIIRASEIHEDIYTYPKVRYVNSYSKVTITCPKHGDFDQRASSHLEGNGCPFCAREGMTHDEFLQKAFDIHGPKYSYRRTVFTETRNDVIITCPEHGDFVQRASAHLSGNGCKHCADDKRRMSTDEFIQKAHDVHDGFYGYEKTNYVSSHACVTVTCPVHGDFTTKPYNHLQGRRCRRCFYDKHPGGYTEEVFASNPELAKSLGVFYITEYEFPNEHFIKVGITQHTAYSRAKSYWKFATILVETPMPMLEAFRREQEIIHHPDLKAYKYYSRNLGGGNTECFTLGVKPFLF